MLKTNEIEYGYGFSPLQPTEPMGVCVWHPSPLLGAFEYLSRLNACGETNKCHVWLGQPELPPSGKLFDHDPIAFANLPNRPDELPRMPHD